MNIEEKPRINLYEGMFLFPQSAAGNLGEAADHIKQILDRSNAEIVSFQKWDERRLAYEIKGNKRGVYFLVYFNCEASKLESIDRDVRLSEQLLRAMMTRAEHLPKEIIEAADGRQQLEDEIKLRSTQAAAGTDTASRASRVERKADGDGGGTATATAPPAAPAAASTDDSSTEASTDEN
ncbi:MAG: 30S ribosomal protein S6 [Planctomycetota bacterium]